MKHLLKLTFFFLLSFCSIAAFSDVMVDPPGIKAGTHKITGRIVKSNGANSGETVVNVTVAQPISGGYGRYEANVDQSGRFSIDVDVELEVTLVALSTSVNPDKSFLLKLTHPETTNIDIAYDANNFAKSISITPDMNKYDLDQGFQVMYKMATYLPSRAPEPVYDKSTEYFFKRVDEALSERLKIVKNDTSLSKDLNDIFAKELLLYMYSGHVFDYHGEMLLNYRNVNGNSNVESDFQKIDRSYYRFLRDLKLNDPQYLQCFSFSEFQNEVLTNVIIGLPKIGDRDIRSWIADVKVILSDLVGFEEGSYYGILAANAYARQLKEEVRPLSEKQKQNIISYWKNGEIAKILFRKNKQVQALDQFKKPTVVNDISTVPADRVMETITAKYQNKVVLVDLWATWCAPCLNAMEQFRSTKGRFQDKDVAFVYLTNRSSPKKLWEEQIEGIGGEQYYLTDAQWEHVMDQFGFDAIPSYLIYDKAGSLIQKFTGFPGSDKVKDMIDEAAQSR